MTKSITATLKAADDATLRDAVGSGDPMSLMGLIYHATQDPAFDNIEIITVPAGLGQANIVKNESDVALVREKAFQLLCDYRDGKRQPPGDVSDDVLRRAMELAAGEPVPEDEFGLHLDVLALDPEPSGWGKGPSHGSAKEFPVIVIGGGLAGINAAVELKTSGIPFELLDANPEPGGTWAKNRYPGARVDWPSRLYSHSYGVDYPFGHMFAPRAENQGYLQWCVERFGIGDSLRFGVHVEALEWLEEEACWKVRSREADGTVKERRARAVITAIGLLDRPFIPQFKGLETFKGKVVHSSQFDPDFPLEGVRAAVVGTGASGLQMVPDLAPLVKRVTVFQRSPAWIVPAPGYRDALPEQALWLDANLPYYTNWTRFTLGWILGDHKLLKVFDVDPDWSDPHSVNAENQAARKFALDHLRAKLESRPDLLEKSIPDYPIFGNRPVMDNGWLDAMLRDDVELVTQPIDCFTPEGIRTTDGTEYPLDLVVMATGFNPNDYFSEIEIIGRDGVRVSDIWEKTGPKAFWGHSVPHLPNLFMLYGPNANPRNLGPVQYAEWAIAYILEIFRRMIQNGWKSVEVREEVYRDFNQRLDERAYGLVSVNPHTAHKSYYTLTPGKSSVQSPWTSKEVWQHFSHVEMADYSVDSASVAAE